jgi:predicted O-methyltransferase YrrM
MTGRLPALAGRRDRASRCLRVALHSTALGRIPPEERAWIDRIEAHRRRLPSEIVAASRPDPRDLPASERMIEASAACQWMSLPPVLGRFLLRLVRELAPQSCLELGTGFGVSTAYQAAALELNGSGKIMSLDLPGMTELAEPGLSRLGLSDRVELLPGLLENTLAAARERAAPIDYALLDADHTQEGTQEAFDAILPALSEGAVVVVDDINWNPAMRRAWRALRGHHAVSAAIDLRRLGIAVVSAERPRRSMKPNAYIPPDSPAATAAHRALMAIRARRVASRDHRRSDALALVLRDTALGRVPSDERQWIERVEARRLEIPFEMAAAGSPGPFGIGMGQSEGSPAPDEATRLARAWGVCRWASIPPIWGRFLTRLVRELGPSSCLELGTGLGLSGAYQALSLELNGEGSLVTLEAHDEAARIADRGFEALGLAQRVELRFGLIEETLPGLLERIAPIDFALIDAEHTEEATTRHFDAVLPYLSEGAVVVLDDITETDEMRRAWRTVIGRDRVSLALGLRRVGVVAVSGPGKGTT